MIVTVPTGALCAHSEQPRSVMTPVYYPAEYIIYGQGQISNKVVSVDFARGPPVRNTHRAYAQSAARGFLKVG